MPKRSTSQELIEAFRTAPEMHPSILNALAKLGLISSKWRTTTMPELMELQLLRARLRQLDAAIREATHAKHNHLWAADVQSGVLTKLEEALTSEVKPLDFTEALRIADNAVRAWEAHSKQPIRLASKSEEPGIPAQLRQDLIMRIAEAFRGQL